MGVVGTKPPIQSNALKYWQLCFKLSSAVLPSPPVHISLVIPIFPTNNSTCGINSIRQNALEILPNCLAGHVKSWNQNSCYCQPFTDITTAITTSSTATLDLTTFTSQFPNLQSRNWEIQRLSSVFRGHCIKTFLQQDPPVGHCWPNYGSQITDPGNCLLNQTIKSQGIVWWTKYIFTLRRVWNSTTKKSRPWLELTLTLKRCLKRRESV